AAAMPLAGRPPSAPLAGSRCWPQGSSWPWRPAGCDEVDWLLNRRLSYCQSKVRRLSTANDGQADLVAWLVQDQPLKQLVRVVDVEAVEVDDHVARLQCGLGCWRA